MKQFLKKYILHNLGFKIVAIVIAVGLWVLFTNMDDPVRTYSFEIPLEVLHQQEFEEGGRYIEIEQTNEFSKLSVTVFIHARNSVIDTLRSRSATSFLSAYIDLYELDSNDPDRLIIHYNITDPTVNAELYSIRNKTYVEVQVEQNKTVEIPIRYEISGSPEEGYLYLKEDPSIVVTPETIRLTGPANQVEKVSYGLVSVSIESENANVTKVGNIVLKDQDGNNITYSRDVLVSSVSEASVFVPIYTYKTLKVESALSGEAPEGYVYSDDLHSTLTAVQVFGPESVLNKMQTLVLPEVHLNLIRGEFSQVFDLQEVLDNEYGEKVVRLMEGQPKEATVTLSTEPLKQQSFSFSVDRITVTNAPTDMEMSYAEKTVTINATGTSDSIDALSEDDIDLSLILGNGDMSLGKHTVKLTVAPIKGITFDEVSITYTLKAKN